MQSVGSILRQAREKNGLSLDDITIRTRINAKNLTAIERDDVSKVSSPFIYRSFVRQYAEELGLEFETLSPAVELLAKSMRQPDLPGQGEHPPVRVAPLQARPKRDFSWIIPSASLFAVIALGSGGYAAWKFRPQPDTPPPAVSPNIKSETQGSSAPAAPSEKPITQPQTRTRPSLPAPVQDQTQTPTPSEASAPSTAGTVDKPVTAPVAVVDKTANSENIHLELAAIERTWLSFSADGKPAYSGILEPEQVKVLDSQQIAKLRTGNAGGVNVIFNGKSIGALGPRGSPRTIIFTPNGYEIERIESAKLTPANHIGG